MIIDTHSHTPSDIAISNLKYFRFPDAGLYYSAGIHPWDADKIDDDIVRWLQEVVKLPQVVAIGECGLDAAVGVPMDLQSEVFRKMISMSYSLRKPLIVHCVRAWQLLIELYKTDKHHQPWIIHGFRGKPQLAEQLINQGFYLSYGKLFNPDSLRITPTCRLLIESDMGNITDTINAVCSTLHLTHADLKNIVAENNLRLFG